MNGFGPPTPNPGGVRAEQQQPGNLAEESGQRECSPPNPPITGGTIGGSGVDLSDRPVRSDRSAESDSAPASTCSPRYRGAGGASSTSTPYTLYPDPSPLPPNAQRPTPNAVDAVLTAGGRIRGEFARETGTEVKALIRLGGETILERTVKVLRETGRIRRIAITGPDELAGHPAASGADAILPEGADGIDNLFRGLEWLGNGTGRTLFVATDLPFLTPEAITGFLDRCPADAEICLPIIARRYFEGRYPGSLNEYVRMRDGEWTMGCVHLLNPQAMAANRRHLERIHAARKSQLAMAWLLGPAFILRWRFGRLGIPHVEARCRSILGCAGVAVLGCDPALAYDIDDPAEYRYAACHVTEGRTAA